jgi:hypothetical protein
MDQTLRKKKSKKRDYKECEKYVIVESNSG